MSNQDPKTNKGDEYYDPHNNEDESDQEGNQKCQTPSSAASPVHSNTDSVIETKNQESKHVFKRSRKTYQWIKRTVNKDLLKNGNSDKIEEANNFSLKVSNLPTNWSFDVIKDVIFEHYGPVNYIYMAADNEMCFVGMVKLEFVNFSDCQKAWENLHGRNVDDIKLFAEMRDIDEESDDEATPAKKKRLNKAPWRPDVDIWDADPKGLYGLKPDFLESLNIKPPIDRWVHVTNFRCDKSELKEVMELAGHVLICTVDNKAQKLGKVMYSHPLEAVQAVSMLNNQLFYGQALKVTIGSCPTTFHFLPKGLPEVGPGLGEQGKPLRDIVRQYERFVQFKGSYVNPEIFRDPEQIFSAKVDDSEIYIPNKIRKLRNDSIDLKEYKLGQNRNKSLSPALRNNSPNVRVKIEGPINDPELIYDSSQRSIGQMGGSIPISKASMVGAGSNSGPMTNSGWPIGLGLMANQGSMGGHPMGVQGPMGGSGPMVGPTNMGPMGGQGPIGGSGPMVGPANMGPMGGQGAMSGMMNNMGSMAGPRPMNNMGGSVPIGVPGQFLVRTNNGPIVATMISNQRVIAPMMNNQGPMVGGPMGNQGPMVGGPMGNQGPMVGGPIGNQGHMTGWPMGNQGPMGGPGPMMSGSAPMGVPAPTGAGTTKATVELSNLPLSTTFPLLCEKMSECGKVMSVQLTTPGSAVVQFAQLEHAQTCYRQYHKRCILGNTIEVKYLGTSA